MALVGPATRRRERRGPDGLGRDRQELGRIPLAARVARPAPRSEEHTSELQSQSNLVCRLLLEKKKLATHGAHLFLEISPVQRASPASRTPLPCDRLKLFNHPVLAHSGYDTTTLLHSRDYTLS